MGCLLKQICVTLVTTIVFNKSPNWHYSPTFDIVPFAFASSTTRHLEFSARTITSAFAGDTQRVSDCISSGNGGTVKDTGSKCVGPIFQRKSENLSSIFKWFPFSTAVNHPDASINLTQTKLAVPQNIHILRWFLQDWHLSISFLLKKAYQLDNFIDQLSLLLLRDSQMVFRI